LPASVAAYRGGHEKRCAGKRCYHGAGCGSGTASVAAASSAGPAIAKSRTIGFDVRFSPFSALHLNPKPDPRTGFGSGDEITFHDLLFSHGKRAGDEGGSCVIVDGSQALANCTDVVRLQKAPSQLSF
jgi:hypothetical protein